MPPDRRRRRGRGHRPHRRTSHRRRSRTGAESTIAVNLKGVFFTVQKTLPLLTDGAAVILNASWTLHRADGALTRYAATKAAVHNLARTLATELGPRGIRVNSISPGYIDTPMSAAAMSAEFATMAAGRVIAGRFGRAEEIAALVAFLGSTEASYITGQDILVDGGLVAAYPQGAGISAVDARAGCSATSDRGATRRRAGTRRQRRESG
ncbi:SDR family NAD(P)-dependent oxidoreductase [Nocardia mangyaensis]|uniref:SDR family NAD(P)-dependent oxidoreductase n=1 Tax=Nocardia mangyaensis TaxID=2213200 RepID=UPI00301559B9